ncbi:hypothetical protein [Nocardia sp. NPDC051570]|uniref:hypothetical protein n=1 Tax=Nocardia sp. NPDC051570 TaxID=3364324 RepID=UPI0037BA2958
MEQRNDPLLTGGLVPESIASTFAPQGRFFLSGGAPTALAPTARVAASLSLILLGILVFSCAAA